MPRLRTVGFGLVFAVLLGYSGVQAWATARAMSEVGEPGWRIGTAVPRAVIIMVAPAGPAAGAVRPGDELVALDGEGVHSAFQVNDLLFSRGPEREYRMTIRRDGQLRELRLRTVRLGVSWASFFLLSTLLLSILFVVSGLVVFLLKPDDKRAVLLGLTLAFMVRGDLAFAALPAWAQVLALAASSTGVLFWTVFLHFFLVFPEPSRLVRRFPRLEWLIYLLAAPGYALYVAFAWLYLNDRPAAWALAEASRLVHVLGVVVYAYPLAGLVVLLDTYRRSGTSSRRKLRVVVAGTLAGLLPVILIGVLSAAVDISRVPLGLLRGLWVVALACLLLIPLSYGYAIVRHQVIPVRVIVRRGVRYLLVSRGFYLVEAGVLLAALGFLLSGSRAEALDRIGERADIAATLVASSLVIGLLTLVNRKVVPAIDRRFFREEYDTQRILAELGQSVRSVATVPELVELSVAKVQEALHAESARVFLLDEPSGEYRSVYPAGQAGAPAAVIAGALEGLRRGSPLLREDGGLLVPIMVKGDLLGALALGPRLGDLPFSREDRDLLSAVAWQTAFAIENARLVRRMAEEESLKRELEVASEVQRRLFPDRPPASRLDLAGVCYPAKGVGGDYYDFLPLGEGQTGIAVADVAGKGISAALLMSIVQASLRSHAKPNGAPLTELVASMNQLLYRSTARNSFATFFYGQFDERSGRLTYVNAGHNPPLLVRAHAPERGRTLRLQTGGLVIGAVQAARYEQESVLLEPGDLLVAYTDGVTEAWSPEGEEFGEARLAQIATRSLGLRAPEVMELIVRRVREFCRGAAQADDLTLVVARVR